MINIAGYIENDSRYSPYLWAGLPSNETRSTNGPESYHPTTVTLKANCSHQNIKGSIKNKFDFKVHYLNNYYKSSNNFDLNKINFISIF